jgi:hypothetical protein
MAITTAFCNSAKAEMMQAVHNLSNGGNTIRAALIRDGHTGTYGAASTSYTNITSSSDESSVGGGGTGYTAGGLALSNVTPTLSGSTAVADFADATWTLSGASATLAADGVMLYNDTAAGDPALSVHAFTGDPSASGDGATFTITWPAADASNAIIRLA